MSSFVTVLHCIACRCEVYQHSLVSDKETNSTTVLEKTNKCHVDDSTSKVTVTTLENVALTLEASITHAADDSFDFFFCFFEKISLDISFELSAKQMILMKCQYLFSLKKKSATNFAWHLMG